jgi:DNA-binding NtrC family response regulator
VLCLVNQDLRGPVSEQRPRLTLLQVSDSFSSVWPTLAGEAGFELSIVDEPGAATGAMVAVSAGGAEDLLEGVIGRLPARHGELVVVGAVPDYRRAVAAIRAGASEYFALPQDLELLKTWLGERVQRFHDAGAMASFASREASKYRFEGILGQSPALRETLERAARVIPHGGVTVLINGETGTGKELLARAIHYNGPRQKAPFVDVNCAAIPENLLESELFGHEKGAFTDAGAAKPGLFEVANGGTIFLDEIGHLSLPLQGKLLRVLEQREMRRVGSTSSITIDVRVIAATHVDLAEAARRGEFREDLYYRLNVVGLRLPALRERVGDVPLLAKSFLARFARDYGLAEPELSPTAERRLLSHPWTGNVRELRNVLERAILLTTGNRLEPEDLGLDTRVPMRPADGVPFPATMSDITRAAAHAMTQLCDGNKSEAARRLGISRTRLLRLLAARVRRAALVEENS